MNTQKTGKHIDNWIAINDLIAKQKLIALALSGLSITLGIGLMISTFQNPLVVIQREDGGEIVFARRNPTKVTEKDIENLIRDFVVARYQWQALDPGHISASIAPLTTEGARRKITHQLKEEQASLKEKEVKQSVADLTVEVSKEQILATFYRVIEVSGIPVATRSTLSFQLVPGSRTKWNPAGLYVNGIIEYQGVSQ